MTMRECATMGAMEERKAQPGAKLVEKMLLSDKALELPSGLLSDRFALGIRVFRAHLLKGGSLDYRQEGRFLRISCLGTFAKVDLSDLSADALFGGLGDAACVAIMDYNGEHPSAILDVVADAFPIRARTTVENTIAWLMSMDMALYGGLTIDDLFPETHRLAILREIFRNIDALDDDTRNAVLRGRGGRMFRFGPVIDRVRSAIESAIHIDEGKGARFDVA